MQVKILSVETGIGAKSGNSWFKAYLKIVNKDGKTNVVLEWLGAAAGIKAMEWCKGGREPSVNVKIGYDDYFRKTILDMELVDDDFDMEVDL